ncbi:MAG: hypothetical protein JSW04_07980, partial [Desulfobacterales bacterium]
MPHRTLRKSLMMEQEKLHKKKKPLKKVSLLDIFQRSQKATVFIKDILLKRVLKSTLQQAAGNLPGKEF